MRVDVYFHSEKDSLEAKLSTISTKLGLVLTKVEQLMSTVQELEAQVAANSSVIDSAVVLIEGIANRIAAAGVDPAKLTALVTELRTKDDALAAAVLANTPVAEPPQAA